MTLPTELAIWISDIPAAKTGGSSSYYMHKIFTKIYGSPQLTFILTCWRLPYSYSDKTLCFQSLPCHCSVHTSSPLSINLAPLFLSLLFQSFLTHSILSPTCHFSAISETVSTLSASLGNLKASLAIDTRFLADTWLRLRFHALKLYSSSSYSLAIVDLRLQIEIWLNLLCMPLLLLRFLYPSMIVNKFYRLRSL